MYAEVLEVAVSSGSVGYKYRGPPHGLSEA